MKIFILPSYQEKKDLICFFPVKHAIECDSNLIYEAILASLQSKHEVFLLEDSLQDLPLPNLSRRWEVGDNWVWLSARSKSTLVETFRGSPMSYCQFKDFLSQTK